jgi:hypothetical protein
MTHLSTPVSGGAVTFAVYERHAFGRLRGRQPGRASPPYTPHSGTAGGNIEEEETIQHSQLPLILNRPETAWEVRHKVGKGHLATGDKGGIAGQYPQRYQEPADEFNNPGHAHQRQQCHRRTGLSANTAEDPKEFLRPVAGKQEPCDNAQEGIEMRGKLAKRSFHNDALLS